MPELPRRKCVEVSCNRLAPRGHARCEECERKYLGAHPRKSEKRYERRRDHSKLYSSSAWQAMRKRQLQIEPFCRECAKSGKLVTATDVDHIQPHLGDIKKFLDTSNLQSLCHACHSRKTASEDGGWGRERREYAAVEPREMRFMRNFEGGPD